MNTIYLQAVHPVQEVQGDQILQIFQLRLRMEALEALEALEGLVYQEDHEVPEKTEENGKLKSIS